MTGLVKSIFVGTGPAEAAAARTAAAQQQVATIAQQNQAQAVQSQGASTNAALGAVGRAPRGQRLLMSSNDGGLATTLGGST